MEIRNFTPHPLNIFGFGDTTFAENFRKNIANTDAMPIQSIQSSGMLSAKIETRFSGYMGDIPVFKKEVVGCDPLPEGDFICVVSALYASAAQKMGYDMSRIYTVSDPVYDTVGTRILGCLGICPSF